MNQLASSKSLYLQQHASNPVNWNSWSNEILEHARLLNKPIVVSVGYSACHWCHVMENESFSDQEVAEFMNQHFVCIKVDREEHPDVDAMLMEAVQLISGNAGWPLNCFLLPDGRPFYGGTYFTRWNWLKLLKNIVELFYNQQTTITDTASKLLYYLNSSSTDFTNSESEISSGLIQNVFDRISSEIDDNFGGIAGSPKFILPGVWISILNSGYFTSNHSIRSQVIKTLTDIANGGIYDHLDGGFFRYSVDRYWKIPHFEKMLYDNAQLLSLYSMAYNKTRKPLFKEIAAGIYSFLTSQLKNPDGGFMSSIDADNTDGEGAYYTWTKKEIQTLLGQDCNWFCEYFNISEKGNIDGKNVLSIQPESRILNEDEKFEKLNLRKSKLLSTRNLREKPATDSKIILSWNSLLICGFIEYYKATSEIAVFFEAEKLIQFIIKHNVTSDFKVYRIVYSSDSNIEGTLEDYAFLIHALVSFYSLDPNIKWIDLAEKLLNNCNMDFEAENGLFYNSRDKSLFHRKLDITDQVMPSSNSIMATNFFRLGIILNKNEYVEKSTKMVKLVLASMENYPVYHSQWIQLANLLLSGTAQIQVNLQQNRWVKHLHLHLTHELAIVHNQELNDTEAIICYRKTCYKPTHSLPETLQVIKANFSALMHEGEA